MNDKIKSTKKDLLALVGSRELSRIELYNLSKARLDNLGETEKRILYK